jgi:hypothetical protein
MSSAIRPPGIVTVSISRTAPPDDAQIASIRPEHCWDGEKKENSVAAALSTLSISAPRRPVQARLCEVPW